MLEILQQNSFYANGKKCKFGKDKIAYLGHVISHEGVAVDNEKIQAMLSWHVPGSLKELKGFLGLTR